MTCSTNVLLVLIPLYISFLFLLNSPANAETLSLSSSDILETACFPTTDIKDWNSTLCLNILRSSPKVISAPNGENLTLEIIDLGLKNGSKIHDYISKRVNDTQNIDLKSALNECLSYYSDAIHSMSIAFGEIQQVGEYYDGRDDLIDSLTGAQECESCVSNYNNITDKPVCSDGIKLFKYFSVPTIKILEMLMSHTYPPSSL